MSIKLCGLCGGTESGEGGLCASCQGDYWIERSDFDDPTITNYINYACVQLKLSRQELLDKLDTLPAADRKSHIVVTVVNSFHDEVDQYQDIIGVYDSKQTADEIAAKLNAKEPIEGIDYAYLSDFKEAVVLIFTTNKSIRCCEE